MNRPLTVPCKVLISFDHDGNLYALEVNMGNVWAFSSQLGVKSRTLIGVETMQQQFDLFETCADAIIENARRLLDLA